MELYKTTVFRVSIQFAAIFVVLSVITLLSVYYFTIYEVETQAENELYFELNELKEYYEDQGFDSLLKTIKQRDEYGEALNHYYTLIKNNNQFIAGSEFLLRKEAESEYEKYGIEFYKLSDYLGTDDHEVFVKYARLELGDGLSLLVGQAQNSFTELREHIFNALLYAVLITLILALIVGSYMGKFVLSRINAIDKGMDKVIESDFTQMLKVPENEDEFQALTIKLNTMLERIKKLIKGMRQVSDNIAHDLRSPLTRMRSRLEVTLLQNRDEQEYREVMAKVIEDCDELLKTFNALLAITQAESGVFRDNLEEIDLSNLVDELADLYHVVVEDSGLTFNWKKPAEKIVVYGSRHSLVQAIYNLLENAIKYTPKGGEVTIEVSTTDGIPSIIVRDTGPGIPENERKRVLERFQRLESDRSKPGNGLGLSMVDAVVKLHHAELILSDNNPGLKVEIRFVDTQKPNV